MFGGDILAGFFTTDVAVIQKGYAYLKGFALETIVTAILFSMVGYFNGNNKTVWVMTQGLIQTLLVRLPFAYVMSIQPNGKPDEDRSCGTSIDNGGNRAKCWILYLS